MVVFSSVYYHNWFSYHLLRVTILPSNNNNKLKALSVWLVISADCPAGNLGGLFAPLQMLSRSLLNWQSDRSGRGQVIFPALWGIKIKIKEKCPWKRSFWGSAIGHWVKVLATVWVRQVLRTGMVEEGSNPGRSPLLCMWAMAHAPLSHQTNNSTSTKRNNFF